MVLIFRNAIFLHVPKTGGTWVKTAVRNAGVACEEFLVDGDVHGDRAYCPFPSRFIFAFVREPLSLYQSYWRFKTGVGWDERNPFDAACSAPRFSDFVDNVLRLEPAWCSRMFEDYVGTPANEIGFIGRFESLADDLVTALERIGEPFDERAIRETPVVNASMGAAVFGPGQEAKVRLSEARCISRFGYA